MAKYGIVESTKLTEPCFDFESTVDVENGMLVVKGDLVEGERMVYEGGFPSAAQLATEKLYLVANPAWNYDTSSTINQNEEEYINKAGRAYRVYALKDTNRFKVTDYTIDPIDSNTPIAEGQFVVAQADKGKMKAVAATPTGVAFYGKVIAIDQSGFPFAIGSAGTPMGEYGYALNGVMNKVLVEVVRNDAV